MLWVIEIVVVGVVFGLVLKYGGFVTVVVKSMGEYNGVGVDGDVVERVGKNWEGWVRWVENDQKCGAFSFPPEHFSRKHPTLALYSMFLSESRCQIHINDSVTL